MLFTYRFELLGRSDVTSVDLPSSKVAWQEAVHASADLLKDVDGKMAIPGELQVQVSDESGRGIYELRVTARSLAQD